MSTDERSVRLNKLKEIAKQGINPYPARFDKKESLAQAHAAPEGTRVTTAGRLITIRDMGKMTFAHLQDESGKMQIALKVDVIGKERYSWFNTYLDLGDYIGVSGEVFKTKRGEVTIQAEEFTFLGKALRPLPEKWHGLKDRETAYRQRYLDLISNPETMERFKFRSAFIHAIRRFYAQEGFTEVETPVLLHKATGAAARPYRTHNNALDIDVVLRISHELPLKELIVGGFEKVFEIGKAFRNEGHDPSHLPEHTHLEHYAAYWDYNDNIAFTEKMFDYLFDTLKFDRKREVIGKDGTKHTVNFATPWKRIDFVDQVKKDSGLDMMKYSDADTLRTDLKKKKIFIEGSEAMGLATLIDHVYKKVSRPKLIQPTILYHFPKILQPLARINDKDKKIVDQFQLVINGWEVVKAYSELVDPIDQRERFEHQSKTKGVGDDEAMEIDEDYLTAMEYGMPPISGWGMGIDRIVTLLTGQENLRDVVLFPLMRPENSQE